MSQRVAKAQELARKVLGEAIPGLKDPRIGFATVTAVRMTADLRTARVFVSVLGDAEHQEQTMAGLRSATPVLRAELGNRVKLKYLPELIFVQDRGAETAQRLEAVLREARAKESS